MNELKQTRSSSPLSLQLCSMLCYQQPPPCLRSEMGLWRWSPWPGKRGRGKWPRWPTGRALSTETCCAVLLGSALQAGGWRRWFWVAGWILCLLSSSECRRRCWSWWLLERTGCHHSTGHWMSQGALLLLGWAGDRWRYKRNI